MVYQICKAIKIPVLGLGGIMTGNDALEFMLAGATAVSIGTGNFFAPDTSIKVVNEIEDYLKRHNIGDINDIIGKLELN
jgi:dihydroorotate dehydrogenase (NAD+) catalytic subunit